MDNTDRLRGGDSPQAKGVVLRELEQLSRGGNGLIESFAKSPDWQQASEILARALDASCRSPSHALLSPPPP